ncbi:MAG: GerMN domain-containing protein [Firmicutes bacterium]|nr:GerMN domain-containing protein [Bacillota bacterium]
MRYIWIVIAISVIILGCYTYLELNNIMQELKDLKEQVALLKQYQSAAEEPLTEIQLYFVKSTPTDFLLVPVTRRLPASEATPLYTLQLLIQGPLPEEDLQRSVPAEAEVLSLSINNSLAIVDFSSELSTKFVGGSQLESHLVNAIVLTLTQFPEINQVQILLNGKNVESIGGHVNIEYPLP